jgi:P2 family phage contractile tail tube protein
MPKYANKVIQYSIYAKLPSLKYVDDTTEVELPELEYKSDTISGAGILGEIDLPSPQQIASMAFKVSMRVDSATGAALSAPKMQEYEARWAVDTFDSGNVSLGLQAHKAVIKCLPKKYSPGKVSTGSAMDASIENEVFYYKKMVDGKVIMEIDKLNGKLVINGTDYSSKLKSVL